MIFLELTEKEAEAILDALQFAGGPAGEELSKEEKSARDKLERAMGDLGGQFSPEGINKPGSSEA